LSEIWDWIATGFSSQTGPSGGAFMFFTVLVQQWARPSIENSKVMASSRLDVFVEHVGVRIFPM